jgi:hypothetical protein
MNKVIWLLVGAALALTWRVRQLGWDVESLKWDNMNMRELLDVHFVGGHDRRAGALKIVDGDG